jgi:hypothetical protein
LYFNAQGVAGLTRGTVAAAAGLLFWLVVGAAVVRWYDRKGLYRLQPEVLAHVNQSVQDYRAKHATPAGATAPAPPPSADAARPPAPADAARPPGGEGGQDGPRAEPDRP